MLLLFFFPLSSHQHFSDTTPASHPTRPRRSYERVALMRESRNLTNQVLPRKIISNVCTSSKTHYDYPGDSRGTHKRGLVSGLDSHP